MIKKAFNECPEIKQYMESQNFIAKTVDSYDVYYKEDDGLVMKVRSGPDKKLLPVDREMDFNLYMTYTDEEGNDYNQEYNFANFSAFQSGWGGAAKQFREDCEGTGDE